MEVTLVGFDSYDYEKAGVRKVGGNLYYVIPVEKGTGSGMKSGSVYVRANSELFGICKVKDFTKPVPGKLLMQMRGDGTAFVTDVDFKTA